MRDRNSPVTAIYVVIILFYVFIVLLNHWIVREVEQISRMNQQIIQVQPGKAISAERLINSDHPVLAASHLISQKSPAINDVNAAATLRTLSTASETYASVNNGNYPGAEASLTGATPPYVNKNHCDTVIAGFSFTCDFATGGYTFTGTPVSIGSSGTTTFTIKTGGVVTP